MGHCTIHPSGHSNYFPPVPPAARPAGVRCLSQGLKLPYRPIRPCRTCHQMAPPRACCQTQRLLCHEEAAKRYPILQQSAIPFKSCIVYAWTIKKVHRQKHRQKHRQNIGKNTGKQHRREQEQKYKSTVQTSINKTIMGYRHSVSSSRAQQQQNYKAQHKAGRGWGGDMSYRCKTKKHNNMQTRPANGTKVCPSHISKFGYAKATLTKEIPFILFVFVFGGVSLGPS